MFQVRILLHRDSRLKPDRIFRLWFIGAGVLGLVMAYGIMRNRTRTRTEKQITEQATKDLYAKEGKDRLRSDGKQRGF